MPSRFKKHTLAGAVVALALAHAGVAAQSAKTWVVPRTADGKPDLEGVWENNSATPLERPAQLAQKPRLSDQELAALEKKARTMLGPEADAVFGDALYLTLLADRQPGGLGATGT